MSQAQLAAGPDRLPWLNDDFVQPAMTHRRRGDRALAATVALSAVAALSFWLGTQSWHLPGQSPAAPERSTTVALPPAAPAPVDIAPERAPQVAEVTQRTVRPTPQPEVRIERPGRVKTPDVSALIVEPGTTSVTSSAPTVARAPARVVPVAHSGPLPVWPARVSTGAYGRLVQIGAFGTRLQAKRGWAAMVRAFPGVSRLQAVVVEARNSHGRKFYRFQIGTTSQAHSEVLCQRMEKIRLSCAVVGLPWKPTGVER